MVAGRKMGAADWAALAAQRALAPVERRAFEAARIAEVKAAGAVPAGAGPALPACAPARGPMAGFVPVTVERRGDGEVRLVDDRFDGRQVYRRADVWEREGMALRADLVELARRYRAVAEAHASAGMRGASSEVAAQRGAAGSGGFVDAVIDQGRWLKAVRVVVGNAAVLVPRRARVGLSAVLAARLWQMVVVDDRCLSDVLRAHGWAPKGGPRQALRTGLEAALERAARVRGLSPHLGG